MRGPMKKLTVYSEFFPEKIRDYEKGNIFKLVSVRKERGKTWYLLSNDVWVREDKEGEYVSDWTIEEAWGRVDETVYDDVTGEKTDSTTIGFVILTISRASGRIY